MPEGIVDMYFATADDKLGVTTSIDPEYNTGNRFEFGNGFYLAEWTLKLVFRKLLIYKR